MNVRGNFWDGETFVVIENNMNRVTGDKDDNLFTQVNVYEKRPDGEEVEVWHEIFVWDDVEWRQESNCAFEAILGVIAKVAAGVRVERP